MLVLLFGVSWGWGRYGVGPRGSDKAATADDTSSTAAKLPNSSHSTNSRKLLVLNNGQIHKL